MKINEEIGKFVAGLYATIKTESLLWKKKYQEDIIELKYEREIAEQNLKTQIDELKLRFKEKKIRIQMEEEQNTRQFRDFLKSIDETESKLLEHFQSLQKPLALIIHHHATELLKLSWNAPDAHTRKENHTKFTDFMLAITKDFLEFQGPKALPTNTIKLINTKKINNIDED